MSSNLRITYTNTEDWYIMPVRRFGRRRVEQLYIMNGQQLIVGSYQFSWVLAARAARYFEHGDDFDDLVQMIIRFALMFI